MEQPDNTLACPFCRQKITETFLNLRVGAIGALNENRGERLAPASWLDALAEGIESRADLAQKNATCPDAGVILNEVASAIRVVIARLHRRAHLTRAMSHREQENKI